MTIRTESGLFGEWAAEWSECRTYRYTLERRWADGAPCVFIMLNPSTATESENDPTNRRTMTFAQQWGFGSVIAVNEFAFRATDPKHMKAAADPVGPENDRILRETCAKAGGIVCAWGVHGRHRDRDLDVVTMLSYRTEKPPLQCLGFTKAGDPRHPLYVPNTTKRVAFYMADRKRRDT